MTLFGLKEKDRNDDNERNLTWGIVTMSAPQQTGDDVVKKAIEITIKIGALLIIFIECYEIIRPFITPIIWAAIIAVAAKPISDWLENKFKLGRKLAVSLLTLVMLAALIVPSFFAASKMTTSAQDIVEKLDQGDLHITHPEEKVKKWPIVGNQLYASWDEAANDVEAYLKKHASSVKKAAKFGLEKASGAGLTVLILTFSIILSGVFLAYADGCRAFLIRFFRRLADDKGEEFVTLASVTIRNVTRGILGVAILQAALAGLGFYAVGLAAAPILALVVMIMSIIRLNPILLMLPLAIYVFSFASPMVAIVYLIWSVVVGLMDNVLTPLIMGKGAKVPTMVIFLGAIGGFIAMGFAGLFVGAVILVVGYELLMLWLSEEKDSADTARSEITS